ncbi:tetratricopeptide repeat protein [Roseateles sp. BYS180W]|uniref:Tetratricopeptide repeat protein n=1 Tax=Roseateles rivi TaxID=3299028 RepID=A0ABW7FV47_9BURK
MYRSAAMKSQPATPKPAMPVAPTAQAVPTDARTLLANARSQAMAEAVQGRLGEGLNLLCDALDLEPMSHEVLADIAALLLSAGELHTAVEYANKALTQQPDHGPSLYALAFALSGLGQAQDAARHLSRLMQPGLAHDSLMREAPELLRLAQIELRRIEGR